MCSVVLPSPAAGKADGDSDKRGAYHQPEGPHRAAILDCRGDRQDAYGAAHPCSRENAVFHRFVRLPKNPSTALPCGDALIPYLPYRRSMAVVRLLKQVFNRAAVQTSQLLEIVSNRLNLTVFPTSKRVGVDLQMRGNFGLRHSEPSALSSHVSSHLHLLTPFWCLRC